MVPAVNPAPASEVDLKLEQARSNLEVSRATEKRIASELKTLQQSGNAHPDDIKNYEIYLSRVQAMVAENQKILEEMEKACARHQGTGKTVDDTKSAPPAVTPSAAVAPEKEAGELGSLDRTLSDSLSEFDQMLLKEMDEIREKSESRMSTLAEEAASAAGRIGETGEASGTSSAESSSAEGGAEAGAEEGGSKASRESRRGESGGSYENVPVTNGPVAGSSSTGGSASGQPGQRPSGSEQDDDIVARQLREAAEKETDPELKKKLWKEYEDYKKAGR